ncbi:hypothetical protein QEN19_001402 [Hanseniaspora menglaensis]
MSDLNKLFRASKLRQIKVARVNSEDHSFNKINSFAVPLRQNPQAPNFQVVTTYESLGKNYEEFGLKASLPIKKNIRKDVIFSDLTNRYKAVPFEKENQSTLNKKKLTGFNFPVNYISSGNEKGNPLIHGIEKNYFSLIDIKENNPEFMQLIKSIKFQNEFKTYVKVKSPEKYTLKKFNIDNFKWELEEFLNEKYISEFDKIPSGTVGSGGLIYNLSGRITNSPNGLIYKNVIPARPMPYNKSLALGFVADNIIASSSVSTPRSTHRNILQCRPEIVEGITINGMSNNVSLKTSVASFFNIRKKSTQRYNKDATNSISENNDSARDNNKAEEAAKAKFNIKSQILDSII